MAVLSDIFDIEYGNGLSLDDLELSDSPDDTVNFISRTRENNGVSAVVKPLKDIDSFPAGLITVAGSGNSVLESFIQTKPFYTGFHVFILRPHYELSDAEKIFYCLCIRRNQFRYSYGRQANRTLKSLELPDAIPQWVYNLNVQVGDITRSLYRANLSLNVSKWKFFRLGDLFEIKKGKRLTKEDITSGKTPFIGAIDNNNGVSNYIRNEPIHQAGTITVNYNGGVAEAFYQPKDYWCSDDVNALYPRFEMSIYMAMFIITIIRKEKYRYNYGRKWHLDRMRVAKIKLPVDSKGRPDWVFMENYIKSLPYSASI